MKQSIYTIEEQTPLTASVFRMRLRGDTSEITSPGQFVNIRLDGRFLRRPISVSEREESAFTILYKILGAGTAQMARMQPGMKLDILTGLGNGFDVGPAGAQPLLIGGGAGAPPMVWLAQELLRRGASVTAVLGFNRKDEIFCADTLEALGARVVIATLDGSAGVRGFVTDAMRELPYTYFYACGPEPMLKAVWRTARTSGQLSFEERMGCGFGACMGCSCRTITGYKRICKDGPVLRKEEIVWTD